MMEDSSEADPWFYSLASELIDLALLLTCCELSSTIFERPNIFAMTSSRDDTGKGPGIGTLDLISLFSFHARTPPLNRIFNAFLPLLWLLRRLCFFTDLLQVEQEDIMIREMLKAKWNITRRHVTHPTFILVSILGTRGEKQIIVYNTPARITSLKVSIRRLPGVWLGLE